MSKIFFPLRSNSAWFLKEEMRNALEMRIKSCLMLYDEIFFQDALYQCTIWEDGCFDMLLFADGISFDRSKITYFKPGSNSALYVGRTGSKPKHKIIGGEAKFYYHVDYFPIIQETGLFNETYIKFEAVDVNQTLKNKAKQEAESDAKSADLQNVLNGNSFFQKKVLESLYIDSTLSLAFEAPFVIDYNVAPVIQWKYKKSVTVHEGLIKDAFLDNWINLGLPDFSRASWEEIHRLRNSNAGIELRKMIQRIVTEICEEYSNISEFKDIIIIVERHFAKELITELTHKLPSGGGTLINLGLNLIPYGVGSIAGGLKDVTNLVLSKRSWVSLLQTRKK